MELKLKYMNLYFPTIKKDTEPLCKAFQKHNIVFGMATSIEELRGPAGSLFFRHSKQVVPGDSMKMAVVQPEQGVFIHKQNDDLLIESKVSGHGHCLAWSQRNPDWLMPVLTNSTTSQVYDLLKLHITECVKHYSAWETMDIVNEGYTSQLPWAYFIPDSIEAALTFSKEANPKMKRYYNGIFIGHHEECEKVIELAEKRLIDGIGIQWHRNAGVNESFAFPALFEFADTIRSLGLPIRFSEVTILDNGNTIDGNKKWAETIEIALRLGVTHYIQWGIHNPGWRGSCLLFDEQLQELPYAQTIRDILS